MEPPVTVRRADVVARARDWIGTPYHHQASLAGQGTDCIGLIRGIWRDIYGAEPEDLPGYGRDWAEATGRETLLEAARRHFVETAPEHSSPGDMLVFRYRPGYVAKHAGILAMPDATSRVQYGTGRLTVIHATEGASVCEVPLSGWWRRRIAGAFRFPGVVD